MKKIIPIILVLAVVAFLICDRFISLQVHIDYLELENQQLKSRIQELEAQNQPRVETQDTYDEYQDISYAELVVDNWGTEGNTVWFGVGAASFYIPPDSTARMEDAYLILTLNGETLDTMKLEMDSIHGETHMLASIEVVTFSYPTLRESDELELWLEVTFDDDSILTACGGGWYMDGGEFVMISG